ncbi:Glycosyltransferase involved in cell wall bisynthesis [Nannocystis exedens]|uniref:Glycosyltransferase involved in cell wall bisynthesis n=1 Tax=Nannocystis exedens TaxID=54 RepID=A0A1I1WZH2_9BACT|nr:glycosyltransferase family 2 protein [Nannocystis exedens]PCC70939.1 Glycosyl transferase family 2 [Nannocystis exedens]SFD99768.1 Glycosyltransferase involved in cell wall bisynthesis [Nannocystis exedens]
MTPFAVVILTRDEELNLPKALASIAGRCPVLIVDSHSVDRTEAVAREYGAEFVVHKFEDYSKQRNWALEQVQDRFEWIYFLDADEEFTPALWDEVQATIRRDDLDGAYVRWDVRILGRKLKHGEFTHAMMLRLMRPRVARFSRGINERVDDKDLRVTVLKARMIHRDAKPMSELFRKHVGYAAREARVYVDGLSQQQRLAELHLRTKAGRVAVLRRIYNKLPLFVRPFINFGRAMGLGAWRDGIPGVLHAGMHALWYPMLIDLLIHEELLRRAGKLDEEFAPRWGGEDA